MKKNLTTKLSRASSVKAAIASQRTKRNHKLAMDLTVGLIAACLIIFGIWNRPATSQCHKAGLTRSVNLINNAFIPDHIQLKPCDTLRIVDSGNEEYELAFGAHARHIEYPGFTEQSIQPNEYLEISTIESGQFTIHDHIRDKAHLSLVVSQ